MVIAIYMLELCVMMLTSKVRHLIVKVCDTLLMIYDRQAYSEQRELQQLSSYS